jgi:AcrR family transcriptional regulator
VKQEGSTGKRPYRMRARAETTAATHDKILDAAEAVFDERAAEEITLADVAGRAGVAVQTVLRHFGTRQGMAAAAVVHAGMKMRTDRNAAPVGDLVAAIDILVDHYDRFGHRILRMLAAEERNPSLKPFVDIGRTYHQEWCEQVFAPSLVGLRGAERQRRIAQIAAVTDIYVWKLLRRDRELSPQQTKLAICELLEPLTDANR